MEESFQIGNEFVNVLAVLVKGFELFMSFFPGGQVFELMIQTAFEGIPKLSLVSA